MHYSHHLNPTEFALLRRLGDGETTLADLARAIGRAGSRTSVLVAGLELKGFIERKRTGMAFRVSLAERGFVSDYRRLLVEDPTLPSLFADSHIDVYAMLAQTRIPLRARDIAWFTGHSYSSVITAIREGIGRGFVRRDGRAYRLSDQADHVGAFLAGYAHDAVARRARLLAPGTVVHWSLGFEGIVSTPQSLAAREGMETGITALSRGGVELTGDRWYYHLALARRSIGIEDHAIDTILLGEGSTSSVTFALIYLKKHEKVVWPSLERLCRVYGLGSLGTEMKRFLRSGKANALALPTKQEFDEKFAMYGE
jgi:predicted transcriptional regulator